jgi:alginate O-acetyltransferase complex protein AlgI
MLGFTFPENFNQPYRAANVTEFWRRWHLTLSSWFRDYVYLPLGGNRGGPLRTYRNLWVVFILCGLWHGAAWTFVVWGCYHGVLLIGERFLRDRFGIQGRGPVGVVTCFVLVTFGWVFFRLDSLDHACRYCAVMTGFPTATGFQYFPLSYYLTPATVTALGFGLFFSLFPFERLSASSGWEPRTGYDLPTVVARTWAWSRPAVQGVAGLALVASAAVSLSVSGFNPFIYFRF